MPATPQWFRLRSPCGALTTGAPSPGRTHPVGLTTGRRRAASCRPRSAGSAASGPSRRRPPGRAPSPASYPPGAQVDHHAHRGPGPGTGAARTPTASTSGHRPYTQGPHLTAKRGRAGSAARAHELRVRPPGGIAQAFFIPSRGLRRGRRHYRHPRRQRDIRRRLFLRQVLFGRGDGLLQEGQGPAQVRRPRVRRGKAGGHRGEAVSSQERLRAGRPLRVESHKEN